MNKGTFRKGIHPNYHKELTCHKAIEVLKPEEELVFPLSQHIGAPCKAIVKKGDRVLVGQKIAEAVGFVSSPIHSSVSGTVKEITLHMTHRGTKENCIIIQNDGLYEEDPMMKEKALKDTDVLTKELLIEKVKEAGIVGLGGATFPTHVKLSTPADKNVDYIIVNAAECEPYLTSDHRVMLEEGEALVGGLQFLAQVFPKAQPVIAIEDNKQDAYALISKILEGQTAIKVQLVHTKYPQGSEKHLIYAVTGREVPSGKLPIEVGCLVHNVDSIVAINRALTKGQPVLRRIVTVSGQGVSKPCNLEVKIGTSFKQVLEYAGYDPERTVKIIAGGPMMGLAISDIDVPVVKGTSAILCFTKEEAPIEEMTNCIRCGKCVTVCPMDLVPSALHRASMHERYEEFLGSNGMDCIECGCCVYICPAKRKIVQSIRTAKAVVRAKKM